MRLIYLLFTLILTTFSENAHSQLLEYQKVIEAPGLRPAIIIERANKWAATSFTAYQAVFQFKDTTTLSLTPALETVYTGGKGMNFHTANHQYKYNLTIEAKQGRLRVTLDNFRGPNSTTAVVVRDVMMKSVTDSQLSQKWKKLQTESWNREYDQIDKEVSRIMLQLEAAVKVAGKNEDW
ncbi:DUF4468 domain-containing protein [Dyadobacter jiangsuensis]